MNKWKSVKIFFMEIKKSLFFLRPIVPATHSIGLWILSDKAAQARKRQASTSLRAWPPRCSRAEEAQAEVKKQSIIDATSDPAGHLLTSMWYFRKSVMTDSLRATSLLSQGRAGGPRCIRDCDARVLYVPFSDAEWFHDVHVRNMNYAKHELFMARVEA